MKDMIIITSKLYHRGGGIPTATQGLFKDRFEILLKEDYSTEELTEICGNYRTVLFSGYETEMEHTIEVLKTMKKKNIIYWHFGTSVFTGDEIHTENWNSIIKMAKKGCLDLMLFCKMSMKSMWEHIPTVKHVPAMYIANNVMESTYKNVEKNDIVGVYSGSGEFWVKNSHTNITAVAMLGTMPIDIAPISDSTREYAQNLGLSVTGVGNLPHEEFLKRMSTCAIITYVTFTEACPMLPLEALMNGTLCLTGPNHDYFGGFDVLSKQLIVERPDDASCIAAHLESALENREEILYEFDKWKEEWNLLCKQNLDNFLKLVM